jgi:hypothetical protein
MSKLIGVASLALLCCLPGGNAQSSPQVFTGQAWLESWPAIMKDAYMAGYSNGYQAAAVYTRLGLNASPGESKRIFDVLKSRDDCQNKMTTGQLTAIVDKAVREHPETWDQHIGVHVLSAVANACAAWEGK